MEQDTINQRLKFLVEKLAPSARAFSELIGESPTNTHNYTSKRNTEPRAPYIQKVVSHFKNVNANWLLTGEGEPFIGDPPAPPITIKGKKARVGIAGNNSGISIGNLTFDNCKQALAIAQLEVEHLRDKLQDKDELLKAKEDTIRLLRARFDNPN